MRISDQEYNRLRVLKAIRRAEPVSRTELAQLTGLAGGTITEVAGELVRRNVLVEEKVSANRMGRPRIALRLNPDAAFVVSATLPLGGSVAVEIANARGDTLFRNAVSFGKAATIEALVDHIGAAIEQTIASGPIPKAAIHSVGVALPAIVDSERGVLRWLATYPVRPVPVAAILQEQLQLPVVVDNGTNIVARAEHWFSADRELEDFALVLYNSWIGLAQYVDGMLWSGGQNLNAELAHVKLGLTGDRPCMCGGRDCLATHASIFSIVREICAQRGREEPPFDQVEETAAGFAREALAGDAAAHEIFTRAGRLLGVALANHINVSNPARILILTTTPELPELLDPPLQAALRESAFPVLHDLTQVQWKVRPTISYAEGAAALVLEQLYRLPGRAEATALAS